MNKVAVKNFTNTLLSITQNLESDSGNMQQLIFEGLTYMPLLHGVDSAGFWLVNDDLNQFECQASIHHQRITQPNIRISSIHQPETYNLLINNKETIIEPFIHNEPLNSLAHVLCHNVCLSSLLLLPLFVKGKNKGFIFLGNCESKTLWKQTAIFHTKILAQLFCRAILAIEHNKVTTRLHHQLQLMSEIEAISKTGGWEYDIASEKVFWTDETYRIHCLPFDNQTTPDNAIKFYATEAQEKITDAFQHAITNNTPYELELPFIDAKGNKKWVRTSGRIRKDGEKTTHVYGALEDITEQKVLFESEKATSLSLKTIVDNIYDCIITIDEQGIIRSANSIVKTMFGYQPNELVDKNVSTLMPEPYASQHDRYLSNYLKTRNAKIIGIGRELIAKRKDGSTFPMELSLSEVNRSGKLQYIGIIRDITERKKAEQSIHKLAFYDDITNARNRHSFEQDLKSLFSSKIKSKEHNAFMLLNIDRFSQINLVYGESNGDTVLKEVAKRLCLHLPKSAKIYRNNADNFFILLNVFDAANINDSVDTALNKIASEVLAHVNKKINIDHSDIEIQARLGVLSVFNKNIKVVDVKPLLEMAITEAKRKGGNTIVFADNNDIEALKRRSAMSLAMKSQKFTTELTIALQPQYSVDGKVVGSEALIRWISPALGLIPPDEFITFAEKNGAILKLGDWIIEKTCSLLALRNATSQNCSPVSINISVKQIAQPSFTEKLLRSIQKYGVPFAQIILEITENSLITDFDLIIDKMRELKSLGIRFSIDDFGTGYSSLTYIEQLPISELKIDKYFVDAITTEDNEVPIINTMLQLAKILNLNVVAEGVESKIQLAYLKNHHCDIIQGYYFSKPLEENQWLALF